MKEELISLFIVISLFLFGNFIIIHYHEQAHKEIYESYGSNTTSRININWKGIFFITEGSCRGSSLCITEQNWVDIIGYHLFAFYNSLWCLFLAYILIKE